MARSLEARRAAILTEIAQLGPAMPGSLVVRHNRCARPDCRCHADEADKRPQTIHGQLRLRGRLLLNAAAASTRGRTGGRSGKLTRGLRSDLRSCTASHHNGWLA